MRREPQERLGSMTRKIGTLQHFRWLKGIVLAILILNVLDAVLTIAWISAGVAEEANPLLADLAHGAPWTFFLVKMALVGLGSLLLWRLRKRPAAVVSIFVGFLAYYFLLLYHLSALELRLLSRLFG